MLLVTFGLPGAGTSFVARALVARGFHAWDADDALPADMRAAIEHALRRALPRSPLRAGAREASSLHSQLDALLQRPG